MRRFLATESAQRTREKLSLEEEEVLAAEVPQDSAEISTDLGEAERSLDVADNLENVADIADQIEEATPAEAALVQTNADMAVAGTEVQPEEIIPVAGEALESLQGKRIATEGIRESAAQIWKTVQAYIAKIWAKIEAFFHKLFGTLPGLLRKIEAMKKKVEDTASKKVKDKDFTMSSGLASLSIDYTPVKNGSELLKALKTYESATKGVFGEALRGAASAGEKIATILEDVDAENVDAQAEKLVKEAADISGKLKLPGVATKSYSGKSYGEGYEVKESDDLLGNVKIISLTAMSGDSNLLGGLERVRKSGAELAKSDGKEKEIGEIKFTTLSLTESDSILDTLKGIVDSIESYERSTAYKDVKKAKAKLDAASSKASTGFNKVDKEKVSAEAVSAYRAMLNFNVSYTRWVSRVPVALSAHTSRVVSGALAVVAKSLSQYE